MPRLARIAADLPHHVTQRGNRRQRTFFAERDYLWQGRFASTVLYETHFLAALRWVALPGRAF